MMIHRVCLIFVLITLFWNCEKAKATASDVIAVFPKIFRPGSPVIVSCNLLKSGQKTVNLILSRDGVDVLQNSSVVTFGKQNNVMINVPTTITFSDINMAKLTYNGGSIWSPLQFDPVACLVFIQTDRKMYAEKEEVKIRIVLLLPSLKPYTGQFNVEIIDGKNKTVQQWLDIRGTKGVYSKILPVPRDSNHGQWRIVVECLKSKTEKEFEVRKYVVPKFKVQLFCPQFYTRSTRQLRCKAKARYFFGKPVTGVIHLQIVTTTNDADLFLSDDYADFNGEFSKSTPLNLSKIVYENDIEVVAKVSDPATGSTVANLAVVKLKRDEKMVWSLQPKRSNFQPGLPFLVFLKFRNLKASSIPVEIEVSEKNLKTCFNAYKYTVVSKKRISQTLTVDNQGFAKLSLSLSSNASELGIMTYHGADKALETLYVSERHRGLVVLPERPYSVVGESSTFEIVTTVNITAPIWYIILSRGTEVKQGYCGQGTHSKFTCSIKIEPNFYPGFRLLFYHASSDGVLSEDSIFIPVTGNPTNNFINISTNKNSSYYPGENVRFTINSTENSVVYLLSVDEGIYQSQAGFDLNIDNVYSALTDTMDKYKSVDLKGGKPTHEPSYPTICTDPCAKAPCFNGGICVPNSPNSYDCKCKRGFTGKLCEQHKNGIFNEFGVYVYPEQGAARIIPFPPFFRPVPQMPESTSQSDTQLPKNITQNISGPMLSGLRKTDHVRSNFPRTWIWKEINMSGRKSMAFLKKIPDALTTWVTTAFCVHEDTGFAILQNNSPIKIQVIQPFFIKLKTPSNVIAGNSAVIQISVFNYHSDAKMILLYVWFEDHFGGHFVSISGHNSTLTMHAIDINSKKFGAYNITVVAYDIVAGYKMLDSVKMPLFVKAPGVPQDYNVPKIFSLNGGPSWIRETLNISVPRLALPDTKFVFIAITGDIIAPSIMGLGHLIRYPCGCGEQTMMYLAPNIYVIQYLKSINQLSSDMRMKAITNINIGIDSELRWRRQDGSFSVWGNSDRYGSTWLTSFVLMCFHQADQFVPVGNGVFASGLNWLLQQQNKDGSFAEKGRVIHYQMQGGVQASRVTMTAYVLLTLLEFKDFPKFKTNIAVARNKAVQFITKSSSINELHGSKHGLALTSYVLQKAGNPEKARQVYADLKAQATINNQYLFWQNHGNRVYEQKLRWQSPNPRARPVDIETSAYALLYLAEKSDMSQGMKIVNWLVSQRNPQGGFSSTQDTVVSLHALSRFSGLLQQSGMDVEVKLKTSLTEKTVHVNSKNKLLVQRFELDKSTASVEISAHGQGFVLIDTNVKYNVMKSGDSAFEINTTLSSSKQTLDTITVNVCVRRKDNKDNGMVVAEVGLPCGYKADLSKTNANGLDHKETTSDTVVLYFKNLRRSWVCFDVTSNRVDKVTESQGVPIMVYDYYEPENYGIASFMTGMLEEMNICQVCPECNICKKIVLG